MRFAKQNPTMRKKLYKAYEDLINSFNQSQETLKNQNFKVVYDELNWTIQESGGPRETMTK